MKKFWVASAATAALAIGAGSAFAGSLPSAGPDRHGWYFGLEAGWSAVNDSSIDGLYSDLQFENQRAAFVTMGHAFERNWRMELEGGWRDNDLEKVNFVKVGSGKLREYSAFLNVHKDIPLSKRWLFDLGAGVGFDNVRFKDHLGNKDGDTVIAGQGILGLTYRLANHWDISATYRYLMTFEDPSLNMIRQTEGDMDIAKHAVTLGLRYGYDEPPPPPAAPVAEAPPPPPAPKQFIIFFGFNKCNITAEADAVLSEAAAAAKSTGAASVKIVGHTDTVGSAAYNQKLSECRANAAKTNLVGKGVAEGSISTSGKGESELMVQTGDGVKEPQNRRATVDLQ